MEMEWINYWSVSTLIEFIVNISNFGSYWKDVANVANVLITERNRSIATIMQFNLPHMNVKQKEDAIATLLTKTTQF